MRNDRSDDIGAKRRRVVALAATAGVVVALSAAGAALAETYAVTPYPGHTVVAVGTNGSNANGIVAFSDSGTATGECIFNAGGMLGCLAGPGLAVSGTGTANGGWAVSGGNATAHGMGWFTPAIAVAATGCATGGWAAGYTNSIVISGTGCATGLNNPDPWYGGLPVTVAGIGDSSGTIAVSGTGNAYARPGTTYVPTRIDNPGTAVSGTGSAYGGVLNVAGGNAGGNGVTLAGGDASANGGVLAVGGGDAEAYGGVAAIAVTGDARGALVNIGFK